MRQAVDIVAIVGSLVPLLQTDGKYVANCPFHEDEDASFAVDSENRTFSCSSCAKSGGINDFLQEWYKSRYAEEGVG